MALEATRQLVRTVRAGGTGRALPAGCYRDPEFFDLEVERILRPGWHAVARWDELPDPGDYRSVDLFGEPILLVRDQQRRLRAFSRICLHRASQLVTGEGNTKRFTCPYHRWTYDLDGKLRAAPFMEDVPDFDRDASRLPELPLDEWQGFVLASANRDAVPLGSQLGAFDAMLDKVGLGVMVHADVLDFDSPWNWKVMVENFIESYHHIGPHAESLHRTYPAKGTHAIDVDGPCVVLENPAVEGADPLWVGLVFPMLLLAVTRGEVPFATWYEMQVDRHDHFHLRIHVLLPEAIAGNPKMVQLYREALHAIHLEDIPMCEGVQAGVQSRISQPGTLSLQEATIQRFHQFLADRLAG